MNDLETIFYVTAIIISLIIVVVVSVRSFKKEIKQMEEDSKKERTLNNSQTSEFYIMNRIKKPNLTDAECSATNEETEDKKITKYN